jgi:putative SOS response-associated peptidase YedK
MTSGMYRQAFESRRCMIPADGFYEPMGPAPKRGEPAREQYFFRHADDRVFFFAGIWERWTPEEGAEPVDTCTIITHEPNDFMAPIHDRMPVILAEADYARWLNRDVPGKEVADVITRSALDGMLAVHVDKRFVNGNSDDERCVTPMTEECGQKGG